MAPQALRCVPVGFNRFRCFPKRSRGFWSGFKAFQVDFRMLQKVLGAFPETSQVLICATGDLVGVSEAFLDISGGFTVLLSVSA